MSGKNFVENVWSEIHPNYWFVVCEAKYFASIYRLTKYFAKPVTQRFLRSGRVADLAMIRSKNLAVQGHYTRYCKY